MNIAIFIILLTVFIFLPFIIWLLTSKTSGQASFENFLNFHDERYNGYEAGALSLANRIEKIAEKSRAMILISATLLFIELFIGVIYLIRSNMVELKYFINNDITFIFSIIYFILVLASLVVSIRLSSTHVLDTFFSHEINSGELLDKIRAMESSQLKQFMIYFLDKLEYSDRMYNVITVLLSSSITIAVMWAAGYFYQLLK